MVDLSIANWDQKPICSWWGTILQRWDCSTAKDFFLARIYSTADEDNKQSQVVVHQPNLVQPWKRYTRTTLYPTKQIWTSFGVAKSIRTFKGLWLVTFWTATNQSFGLAWKRESGDSKVTAFQKRWCAKTRNDEHGWRATDSPWWYQQHLRILTLLDLIPPFQKPLILEI